MLSIVARKLFVKKKASSQFMALLICVLILCIVLYYSVNITGQMNAAIKKSRIERDYMLAMESKGYLTAELKTTLEQELIDMGVDDISFDGTTLTEVGYGQPIYLCVTGKIHLNDIMGLNGWSWLMGGGIYDFKINQRTTAKY